jgi:hypothetical protein
LAVSEVTRTVALMRASGAESSRSRQGTNASALIRLVCLAAAMLIGVFSGPAAAQSPSADPGRSTSDLLQPSLQGNPATPPRFRKPGQKKSGADQPPTDTFAPSRIGATPSYGSPDASGAGNTGFSSRNTPREKRKKPALPAPRTIVPQETETTFTPVPTYNAAAAAPKPPAPEQIKPPPPEVYPRRAALRIGATLPDPPEESPVNNPPAEIHPVAAATRPGATLAAPGPQFYTYAVSSFLPDYVLNPPPPNLQPPNTFALGQVPQRLLPILAEPDPYAALGIRAGSFILLPSLDFSSAASTNPERVPGGPPAAYVVAAPELIVRSDWERHSLTADIAGSWTQYMQDLFPSLNVPYMNSKVDGRIDVTRDTQINLQLRGIINTDNPGSPNNQFGLAQLPINFDVGQTVGITQQFNRLTLNFRGTFDRTTYNPSLLTDGEYSSNGDRNFDQWGGVGRIAYEYDPGLRPFIQIEGDQRVHDEPFDRNNLQRESVGLTGKIGASVNMFGSLTGEMAIGYVDRVYKDPTLPTIQGVVGDGALIWQPTALTTAKLSATSQIYETTVNAASGQFSRDLAVEVDHAFRYWLVGILKGGYGNDVYPGSGLQDNRWYASVGAVYKLTREWQLNATVRQDWQIATQPTFTFNATSVLLGVRVQR